MCHPLRLVWETLLPRVAMMIQWRSPPWSLVEVQVRIVENSRKGYRLRSCGGIYLLLVSPRFPTRRRPGATQNFCGLFPEVVSARRFAPLLRYGIGRSSAVLTSPIGANATADVGRSGLDVGLGLSTSHIVDLDRLPTSMLFVTLPQLGAGPIAMSTRFKPRAQRWWGCAFCQIAGGGTFSMSSWSASAMLPLPFPCLSS